MPATRSPAQIEASRRNGARSHGPVTPEGKARASRNALTHGLCAMQHLVLEDEVPDDLAALIAQLTEEVGAASEIEARLARRLAIAFWKGERAERIEVALFDAAPKLRPPQAGFEWEEADPLTTFDVRRFNAIRGQQAQLGREIRNCLTQLRALRRDSLARTDEPEDRTPDERDCTNDLAPSTPEPDADPRDEPDDIVRNEPERPPPANDDAAPLAGPLVQNEPGNPFGAVAPDALWLVDGVPLLDGLGRPRLHPLARAAADWRMRRDALEAPQAPATQAAGPP